MKPLATWILRLQVLDADGISALGVPPEIALQLVVHLEAPTAQQVLALLCTAPRIEEAARRVRAIPNPQIGFTSSSTS